MSILEILIFFILSLILLIWIGFFILAMRNYLQLPLLKDTPTRPSSQQYPLVSLIVPTRNEAYRVEKCIRSLKAQTYPHLEILIVDDSTDNTRELITSLIGTDPRFRIIKQDPLPEEWIGKPFALQQGSRLANGEYLVFIDADTYHDPMLITRTVDYALEHDTDLLSLVPHNAMESFWERLIQPIPLTILTAGMPLAKVNKPDSTIGIAFGTFILIKHTVFDAIGGYESIKGRIADDVEMGKLVRDSGYKVGLVNGLTMMHVRMYENFHEIWEGWSKNIFLGSVQKRGIDSTAQRLFIVVLGVIGLFGVMVFPLCMTILALLLMVLAHASLWQGIFLFALIVWLVGILLQAVIQKAFWYGNPAYAVLNFLSSLIIIGIFVNSAVKSMSGAGVTWKGRTYTEKKS
jgi:chlorobactene glucosyltransferase